MKPFLQILALCATILAIIALRGAYDRWQFERWAKALPRLEDHQYGTNIAIKDCIINDLKWVEVQSIRANPGGTVTIFELDGSRKTSKEPMPVVNPEKYRDGALWVTNTSGSYGHGLVAWGAQIYDRNSEGEANHTYGRRNLDEFLRTPGNQPHIEMFYAEMWCKADK